MIYQNILYVNMFIRLIRLLETMWIESHTDFLFTSCVCLHAHTQWFNEAVQWVEYDDEWVCVFVIISDVYERAALFLISVVNLQQGAV